MHISVRAFFMSNPVQKIRHLFTDNPVPMTLKQIQEAVDLKASQISMVCCYLMRQRYMTRELVDSTNAKGRKKVWLYQYYSSRQPKEEAV